MRFTKGYTLLHGRIANNRIRHASNAMIMKEKEKELLTIGQRI